MTPKRKASSPAKLALRGSAEKHHGSAKLANDMVNDKVVPMKPLSSIDETPKIRRGSQTTSVRALSPQRAESRPRVIGERTALEALPDQARQNGSIHITDAERLPPMDRKPTDGHKRSTSITSSARSTPVKLEIRHRTLPVIAASPLPSVKSHSVSAPDRSTVPESATSVAVALMPKSTPVKLDNKHHKSLASSKRLPNVRGGEKSHDTPVRAAEEEAQDTPTNRSAGVKEPKSAFERLQAMVNNSDDDEESDDTTNDPPRKQTSSDSQSSASYATKETLDRADSLQPGHKQPVADDVVVIDAATVQTPSIKQPRRQKHAKATVKSKSALDTASHNDDDNVSVDASLVTDQDKLNTSHDLQANDTIHATSDEYSTMLRTISDLSAENASLRANQAASACALALASKQQTDLESAVRTEQKTLLGVLREHVSDDTDYKTTYDNAITSLVTTIQSDDIPEGLKYAAQDNPSLAELLQSTTDMRRTIASQMYTQSKIVSAMDANYRQKLDDARKDASKAHTQHEQRVRDLRRDSDKQSEKSTRVLDQKHRAELLNLETRLEEMVNAHQVLQTEMTNLQSAHRTSLEAIAMHNRDEIRVRDQALAVQEREFAKRSLEMQELHTASMRVQETSHASRQSALQREAAQAQALALKSAVTDALDAVRKQHVQEIQLVREQSLRRNKADDTELLRAKNELETVRRASEIRIVDMQREHDVQMQIVQRAHTVRIENMAQKHAEHMAKSLHARTEGVASPSVAKRLAGRTNGIGRDGHSDEYVHESEVTELLARHGVEPSLEDLVCLLE